MSESVGGFRTDLILEMLGDGDEVDDKLGEAALGLVGLSVVVMLAGQVLHPRSSSPQKCKGFPLKVSIRARGATHINTVGEG